MCSFAYTSSRILAEFLFHELITFSYFHFIVHILFPSAHFNIPYGFILLLILYCMNRNGKRQREKVEYFMDTYYVYYIDWASVPAKAGRGNPNEHQSDSQVLEGGLQAMCLHIFMYTRYKYRVKNHCDNFVRLSRFTPYTQQLANDMTCGSQKNEEFARYWKSRPCIIRLRLRIHCSFWASILKLK